MNNVLNIASFFVGKGVSPLKLQKLLYYSKVWFFVKTGKDLFYQDIKAWIYGPVVPDIWQKFKYIRRTDIIPSDRLDDYPVPSHVIPHLEEVWDVYGHLSGSQLVDLTHKELPWRMSRIGYLGSQPSSKPVVISKTTTSNYILTDGKIPEVCSKLSLGIYSNKHF